MDYTHDRSFDMVFPPSKIGDKYNYEVATYLKIKGIPELGSEYDLKTADINPTPKLISKEFTLFGTNISFDIIASTASWEMFIECKHSEQPRPIKIKDSEFVESVAEFLSVLPLGNIGYKEYKYLLITNSSTNKLANELNDLRISLDADIQKFLDVVKETAKKKWSTVDVSKVTEKDLRKCLNNIRVLTVEDGSLEIIRDTDEFKKIFDDFYANMSKRLPNLPTNLPSTAKLVLSYQGSDFIEGLWNSYSVYISRSFIDFLIVCRLTNDKFKEISFESIPSSDDFRLIHDEMFSPEIIEVALSSCINDYLQNKNIAVIISPGKRRLYLFDPFWLYQKTSELKENDNHFSLNKIRETLSLPLGGSLLRIAIQESYRIARGIIYVSEYFDE